MLRCFIFLLLLTGMSSESAQATVAGPTKPTSTNAARERLDFLLQLPYDVMVADLEQGRIWADSMLLLARQLKADKQLAQAYQKSALIRITKGITRQR